MGKSSKAPTQPTETTVTNTNLPDYLEPFVTRTVGNAEAVANRPYEAYSGPRIASFNEDQTAAFDLTRALPETYSGDLNRAGNLTGIGAMGSAESLDRIMSGPRTFGSEQATQYMNPFIDSVLNRTTSEATKALQEQQARRKLDTSNAAPFGSYGDAVANSLLERDFADRLATTQADLLFRGYNDAQQQFERDRQFGLTSDRAGADVSRGIADIGRMFSDLGGRRRDMAAADIEGLRRIGLDQQLQDQASLDLAYQDFDTQRNFERSNIEWLSNIIRGLPSAPSSTTQSFQAAPNPYSQVLGLATGATGLAKALGS